VIGVSRKIRVGVIRARKLVTVTAEDHCFHQSVFAGETVSVVPCAATKESRCYRAYKPAGRDVCADGVAGVIVHL
jgi:hypothetical protein